MNLIQNGNDPAKFTLHLAKPPVVNEPPLKKRKNGLHGATGLVQELFGLEITEFHHVADQISLISAISKMKNHSAYFRVGHPTLSLLDDKRHYMDLDNTSPRESRYQCMLTYSLEIVNSAGALDPRISQTPAMRRLFGYILDEPSFLDKPNSLESSITPQFFYDSVSKPSGIIPPKELAVPHFIPKLLRYQRESVRWCLRKEGKDILEDGTTVIDLDPEIRDFVVSPPLGWSRADIKLGNTMKEYWINPYSGCICDEETLKTEFSRQTRAHDYRGGGLLGEEMGLGKTVEILALVLLNPRERLNESRGGAEVKANHIEKEIIDDEKQRVGTASDMNGITNVTVKHDQHDNPRTQLADDAEVGTHANGSTKMEKLSETAVPIHKLSADLVYDPFLGRTVLKAKTTLIISPTAICSQWVSEIRRHAPSLKVTTYKGKKSKGGAMTPQEMASYDIIVTTYPVIATEFHYAFFDPGARRTRNVDQRSQDQGLRELQSPLVQIQFWRVVLDEVQMVNSGVSNSAKVAKIVPRVHAWGVTGTPVKGNMIDLQGLLIFLRHEPFASSPRVWSQIMALPAEFSKLFSSISIRHSMAQVEDDLVIPPQRRYLLSIPFNSIEENNYQHIFQNFLADCGLDTAGNPLAGGPREQIDMSKMESWLIRLRQACCHPRIGYGNRRALGGGSLRTVDEVLQAMHDQANSQFLQDQRKLFVSIIERGQLREKDKDSAGALTLWTEALEGVEPIVKSLREDLAEKEKLKAKLLQEREEKLKQLEVEALNCPITKNEDDFEDEDCDPDEVVRASRLRLRSWLEVLHRCYFLVASGHFQMYSKPGTAATEEANREEEKVASLERLGTKFSGHLRSPKRKLNGGKPRKELNGIAKLKTQNDYDDAMSDSAKELTPEELQHQKQEQHYYNLAEILRRELLEESISKVENLSKKLIRRSKVQHFVVLEDATIEASEMLLGFESRAILNKINELGACLNQQAEVIDAWRERLIGLLCQSLVDKDVDPDGEEYGESLDAQEYAFTYVEVLQQALSDRSEAINGITDPVVEGVQRSNDLKSAYQLELEAERKKLRPIQAAFIGEATFEFSLKGYLSAVKRISGVLPLSASSGRAQAERHLLGELGQKVQKLYDTQRSELRKLNRELQFFRDLYNARVEYYRQLQEISDNVAEINIGKQTIYAAAQKRLHEETALRSAISQQIGRKRYLESLTLDQEAQEADRMCIICQSSFYIGALTNCGHQFCRECLQEWWNMHENCPVCKKKLGQDEVYGFTYRAKDAAAIDLSASWLCDESNESVVRNGIFAAPSKRVLNEILGFDLARKWGSKIDFMLKHLKWLQSKDPEVQVVIFSQWSEMLKLIAMALSNQNVKYATMKHGIDEFRQDSTITCFLLHAKNES